MEAGYRMRKGFSSSLREYEDQSEPECDSRSPGDVETFSLPRISTKSAHAACRFDWETLCFGGGMSSSEVVEVVGSEAGFCDPR